MLATTRGQRWKEGISKEEMYRRRLTLTFLCSFCHDKSFFGLTWTTFKRNKYAFKLWKGINVHGEFKALFGRNWKEKNDDILILPHDELFQEHYLDLSNQPMLENAWFFPEMKLGRIKELTISTNIIPLIWS